MMEQLTETVGSRGDRGLGDAGGPVGVPALSPGHTTTLGLTPPPGRYALVTWYPNFRDGNMLAAPGQFGLVTVV